MNKMTWPVLAGLLLCCVALNAPIAPIASAGETIVRPVTIPTWYLFCTAAQPKRELEDESVIPDAIYYSDAFTVTMNTLGPVSEAFLKFLQERHGYVINPSLAQPVTCYADQHSLADAQAERQKMLSKSQQYSDRQQVIETGWTFASTPSAPPAQPAQ